MAWFTASVLVATILPAEPPPQSLSQKVQRGPVSLVVEVAPATARIAEPVTFRVQVDAPRGTRVTLPPIADSIGSLAVIRGNSAFDLPVAGDSGMRRWVQELQLESLTPGEQQVPSVVVPFELPTSDRVVADRRGELKSEPLTVRIASVLGVEEEATDFRDIKDATAAPRQERPQGWLGVLTAVAIAFALAAGGIVWKRRANAPSPQQWALREVDRIEIAFQHDAVSLDDVYAQLASVLRGYLQASFDIPAKAQSSEEVISALECDALKGGCSDSLLDQLKHFFAESDQLRFSGKAVADTQEASPFKSVRAIVDLAAECRTFAAAPSQKGGE